MKDKIPEFNHHHRKPRSRSGTDDKNNVVLVEKHKHDAWHCLFGNKNAIEIAECLNDTWLDPNFKMIVVPAKMYNQALFYLNLILEDK